jgi:hypothetical protein
MLPLASLLVGGLSDPVGADHHGKFRGHPQRGNPDALHRLGEKGRLARGNPTRQGTLGKSEGHDNSRA